jgi:hypothetical protein
MHYNQNAFVKGRYIFDAVRTTEDLLDYVKHHNLSGMLTAIDFEKAFDSVHHDFLLKFNFGHYFLQWIKMLYIDISSCVVNNGIATSLFGIIRGVRQGDPLSPALFIIILEALAINIRKNDLIQGFDIRNEVVKMSIFADDMSCFLKNKLSYV